MEAWLKYKFRTGLIIQRDGYIDKIKAEDIRFLYRQNPKINFQGIVLDDIIFSSFGFKKSVVKIKGYFEYYRLPIIVSQRPLSSKYLCINMPTIVEFEYLHELQDFYSYFDPYKISDEMAFNIFVSNFGSRRLENFDI